MRECASPGHQTVHQPSVQLQYSNKKRHCLNIHVTDCVVVLLQMDILFFYSSLPVGCNMWTIAYITSRLYLLWEMGLVREWFCVSQLL